MCSSNLRVTGRDQIEEIEEREHRRVELWRRATERVSGNVVRAPESGKRWRWREYPEISAVEDLESGGGVARHGRGAGGAGKEEVEPTGHRDGGREGEGQGRRDRPRSSPSRRQTAGGGGGGGGPRHPVSTRPSHAEAVAG